MRRVLLPQTFINAASNASGAHGWLTNANQVDISLFKVAPTLDEHGAWVGGTVCANWNTATTVDFDQADGDGSPAIIGETDVQTVPPVENPTLAETVVGLKVAKAGTGATYIFVPLDRPISVPAGWTATAFYLKIKLLMDVNGRVFDQSSVACSGL